MVAIVVDDDAFQLLGASSMFLDAGYRVLEAHNADEALRLFETNADIRLLFTDVSMPGSMSGSGLAQQVAERWPHVRIIMTSGSVPGLSRSPRACSFMPNPITLLTFFGRQEKIAQPPLGG